MTKHTIAPEKFVAVWNASTSTKEVARKTGIRRAGLSAKASALRRKGHKLKEMAPGNSKRVEVPHTSDRERLVICLEAVLAALKSI